MPFRLKTILLASMLACPLWAAAAPFTISSPDFVADGLLRDEQVFNGFGCTGKNVSPALQWQGVPAGTQSLAVTVYDPDAPTGSGWWHWQVLNLPAGQTGLASNAGAAGGAALPAGASQGRSDYGSNAFGGACPPQGDKPHRYIFTVYALKVPKLDLPADASAALTGYMIHANVLGQASVTARYGR